MGGHLVNYSLVPCTVTEGFGWSWKVIEGHALSFKDFPEIEFVLF